MAARIAHPLPDAARNMRTSVQRNKADIVDHFDHDHHRVRASAGSDSYCYNRSGSMGGPATGQLMQRSCSDRYSGPSVECSRTSAARSVMRFCAAGVSGGIRPSGGSTINEVRACLKPAWFRDRTRIGCSRGSRPPRRSHRECPRCCAGCVSLSYFAASSGVRTAFQPAPRAAPAA